MRPLMQLPSALGRIEVVAVIAAGLADRVEEALADMRWPRQLIEDVRRDTDNL